MSYIRCTSNPEALYIWADVSGNVNITHDLKYPLCNKNNKFLGSSICVPVKDFHKACMKWNGYEGEVNVNGFKIEEKHIFLKTGKEVKVSAFGDKRKHEFLVKISYGKLYFYCWRVTWDYVCNNVKGRHGG